MNQLAASILVRRFLRYMADQIPIRRHRLLDLHSYDVTGDELDQIEQEAMEVGQDLTFASISITALVSIAITLTTVTIQSDRTFSVYVAVAIAVAVFSVYFTIKWQRGKKRGVTIIQRIRQREVGPLGEEGREVKRSELDQLPSQEPKV